MKEEYVTHEQSQALKRLGFDWKTYEYYFKKDNIYRQSVSLDHNTNNGGIKEVCSAPTLALAQKWLRDTKGLHVLPHLENVNKPDYVCIVTLMRKESVRITDNGRYFPIYELALSAGIDAALELLTNKLNK